MKKFHPVVVYYPYGCGKEDKKTERRQVDE